MISDLFLNLTYWFISFIIMLFPQHDGLAEQITENLSLFFNYLNKANLLFPVSTIITAFSLIILVEVSIFTFKIYNYIYSLVTKSSSIGFKV